MAHHLLEACFEDGFLAVFLPVETCQRVSIEVSYQWTNWIFNRFPACWAPVWRQRYPSIDVIWHFGQNHLRVCTGCISVLAGAVWHPCNRIKELCSRHMRGTRSFITENSEESLLIFDLIAPEDDSAFVNSKSFFQLTVLFEAQIHQSPEVDFCTILPGLGNNACLGHDFVLKPCRKFLQFCPFFFKSRFRLRHLQRFLDGHRSMHHAIPLNGVESFAFVVFCQLFDRLISSAGRERRMRRIPPCFQRRKGAFWPVHRHCRHCSGLQSFPDIRQDLFVPFSISFRDFIKLPVLSSWRLPVTNLHRLQNRI